MKTHKPKRRFGVILVIIGVICLAAAVFLIVYNKVNDLRAESFSRTVVSEIEEYIAENETEQQNETTPAQTEQDKDSDRLFEGYRYIGYLTIPDLSLKLPVMSDWSYEGLNLSPCRYSGSVETDDLVIAAHNYDSHFGRISELSNGAQVLFTDLNGSTERYEVVSVDTLNPVEIEKMTSGDYDLSLFTCTPSGMARVTVRCDKLKN